MNIAGAGLFGAGVDIGVRSAIRGVRRAVGRPYLGPDAAPATPDASGGGAPKPSTPEGEGAGLEPQGEKPPKKSPAQPGTVPPDQPPVRPDRGADPMPPAEALDLAARHAPEGSLLRHAADGDEQALRDVAKKTGQDGDPFIKHALDELEIEKLFPTPLAIDDGAHLEALARSIRSETGAADLPAGDAIKAPVPSPILPMRWRAEPPLSRASR